MKSKLGIYGMFVGIALIVFIVFETMLPKIVDWKIHLDPRGDKPYDCSVLYASLEDLFPEQAVQKNMLNYYSFNQKNYNATNLIIVQDRFHIDKSSIEALEDYISKGNKVFLSCNQIVGEDFSEVFGLDVHFDRDYGKMSPKGVQFNNVYGSYKDYNQSYITNADSIKLDTLGQYVNYRVNFASINIGDGQLFLHTSPLAFTNYHLLNKETLNYAQSCLLELPNQATYYDFSLYERSDLASSKLFYILSIPALRSAYFLSLILGLLFMIFYGKRRQRIIPTISELQNDSLVLTESISNLFLQHRTKNSKHSHYKIALKIIVHFKAEVGDRWQIRSFSPKEEDIKRIANKLEKKEKKVEEFLVLIKKIETKKTCLDDELIQLNTLNEYIRNINTNIDGRIK